MIPLLINAVLLEIIEDTIKLNSYSGLIIAHLVGMDRIQVNRLSFRRKGSNREKKREESNKICYDYSQMTHLR